MAPGRGWRGWPGGAIRTESRSNRKMKISQAKIEANRDNARQSTGPKDTRSTRYNAAKHGLLAEGVTELDSPAEFAAFRLQFEKEYRPVGVVETHLVHRIALCFLRPRRAQLLEAEYITAQLNPRLTTIENVWTEVVTEKVTELDPGLPARLWPDSLDALVGSFGRYETAIENKLYRAMNQLERLQRMRKGEKVAAPSTMDVSVHSDKAPDRLASFGNQGGKATPTI